MTQDELDRLEALANAATLGPWEVSGKTWDGDDIPVVIAPSAARAEVVQAPTEFSAYPTGAFMTVDGEPANMAFIAAARDAVPALVAEVKRLRALVEAAFSEGWHNGFAYERDEVLPYVRVEAEEAWEKSDACKALEGA